MNPIRHARIMTKDNLTTVRDYLPDNYEAHHEVTTGRIIVHGRDDHGWTLDGYVIPRLASGLIVAEEFPLGEPSTYFPTDTNE